jgi:transposase
MGREVDAMQGQKAEQDGLFHYGSLDGLIPQDDPYRRLEAVLNLGWLRRDTRGLYGNVGRPSVDPVVVVKLLIIAYLQGISSERGLMRQVQVNLSYRRFVHYGLSENLPDHSSLTRTRQRLGEATMRKVFEYVLQRCLDAGLVGREASVDSTFVQANASLSSLRPRLVVAKASEAAQQTLRLFQTDAAGGEEDSEDDKPKRPPGKRATRRNDAYVSKTDSDAGIDSRPGTGVRLGYLVHFAVDSAKQIITAVRTTGAQQRDAAQLVPLIDQAINQGVAVEAVTADRGYSTAAVYHALAQRDIEAFIPMPDKGSERKGRFGHERFTYDSASDRYLCPAGKSLNRQKKAGPERHYRAGWRDCGPCPLREQCTAAKARTLTISPFEDDLAAARARLRTPAAGRAAVTRRVCSERMFAEAKGEQGLGRAHYRGLSNTAVQALLTATVLNLKRYLRAQTRAFPAAAALREAHSLPNWCLTVPSALLLTIPTAPGS